MEIRNELASALYHAAVFVEDGQRLETDNGGGFPVIRLANDVTIHTNGVGGNDAFARQVLAAVTAAGESGEYSGTLGESPDSEVPESGDVSAPRSTLLDVLEALDDAASIAWNLPSAVGAADDIRQTINEARNALEDLL